MYKVDCDVQEYSPRPKNVIDFAEEGFGIPDSLGGTTDMNDVETVPIVT